MTKEDKARLGAMTMIRDMLQNEGAEKTLQSLNYRIGNGYALPLTSRELDKFSDEVKLTVLDTVLIMCLAVLHDEFGFGAKRLNDFKARFNLKSQCIADGYIMWKDIQETLLDECGIATEIKGSVYGVNGERGEDGVYKTK